MDRDKNESGLASLTKGQLITGKVMAVDQQVTFDFSGEKVTIAKSNQALRNVVPGEWKTFEVLQITENEIELKLLGDLKETLGVLKAVKAKDTDWDAYKKQKEQSAKKAEQDKEYSESKKYLEQIDLKMTERDYQTLEEEGFPLDTMTLEGINGALTRMKSSQTGQGQASSQGKNSFHKTDIINRLRTENLPENDELTTRVMNALELSATASSIDDKTMQYLISQDSTPTIENLYKAYHNGKTWKPDYQQELNSQAWSQLKSQVLEVIDQAGYEVNNENLQDAKWLIEHNLPLTKESFTFKKELENIKATSNKEIVLDQIVQGIKDGIVPKDVALRGKQGVSYAKLREDIQSIGKDAISQAVREGTELTIRSLSTIQEKLQSGKPLENNTKTTNSNETEQQLVTQTDLAVAKEQEIKYQETKAHRQLEEVRLKMTQEAALRLEKKGISIETEQLEKLVENLRELEESYYREYFTEVDTRVTEQSLELLKQTSQSIDSLRFMPSYVLGSTLKLRDTRTIPDLLTEGSRLQAELMKAEAAYETLMTVPNQEYGDSIKKAFNNMSSLLTEMGIEDTELNQRAVRILGYNRMEITKDAINQVKAYDLELTSVIESLHPAVAVRMIKEGINPLEIPITELSQMIDRIKQEQGITAEDRFSTYLHKLDKEHALTKEERNSYIGIYRLLYNIEKTDGAALGSVVDSGRELTLGNLLSAVRTLKKGSVDAIIDEEFGELQRNTNKKDSITDQLKALTEGNGASDSKGSNQDNLKEQTQYLNRMLKQMMEKVTPDKLSNLHSTIVGDLTGEAATDFGIWDTMKDLTVEKLWEQLRNTKDLNHLEEDSYARKTQELRDLCKNSEQSIRFLNDFKVPNTPVNLLMANQLLSNGETAIKRLLKQQNENIVENTKKGLKEIKHLSDTLINKDSAQEAYEQLEATAKEELEQAYSQDTIDLHKLSQLKQISQQLTFYNTLAKKECYQIPIETDGNITNINLTILRGQETSGRVSVSIRSEQLGNIKADISLKEQNLKGFIGCDNKVGLTKLQTYAEELTIAAKENDVIMKQLDFGLIKENESYIYQNSDQKTSETPIKADTERTLYRVAKALVQVVRLAEMEEKKN
jgi:hypothetical protein